MSLKVKTATMNVLVGGAEREVTILVLADERLVSISAVYNQGSKTVYNTASLDSLKEDLVVTAVYGDTSTEVITDYTLSGTLTVGTSTITVAYQNKTTTFTVEVTMNPSSLLPEAYQLVEWVGTNDYTSQNNDLGAYFDTGISLTSRSQMEGYELYFKASAHQPANSTVAPLVSFGSNAGLYFGSARSTNSASATNKWMGWGASASNCFSDTDVIVGDTAYEYHVYWDDEKGVAECGELSCERAYTDATGTYPLRIGSGTWDRGATTNFKFYDHIRLLKDSELIHDYYPCYRKADGVVGFYDIVDDEFKTNDGTGTYYYFVKGADVV